MVATPSSPPIDLERIVADANLPALPISASRLLELSDDAERDAELLAARIEADPGLTAQVLRFVNSSYFGLSREIANVRVAVTMIGAQTIKNFALWSATFALVPGPATGGMNLTTFGQDALRRGLFARALAQLLGSRTAEDGFAAALLQDVAIPVLAREIGEPYRQLFAERDFGRVRLSNLEQDRFGFTHAQAGARMAREWNLPEEVAALVECHTQIDELLAASSDPQSRACELAVAVSALLPAACDPAWFEAAACEAAYNVVRPTGAPALLALLGDVDREFHDVAPALPIGESSQPLVDRFWAAGLNRA